MQYLTLEQSKKHINIESDFVDDDVYITSLIDVAECSVELHVNQSLEDIATVNGGVLPAPLIHAMLLMVGNFYANREMVSFASKTTEIPFNYVYLIDFYKNYSN